MSSIWRESISKLCQEQKIKMNKSQLNRMVAKRHCLFKISNSKSDNESCVEDKECNQKREEMFLMYLQSKKDTQSPVLTQFKKKVFKLNEKIYKVKASDPFQPQRGSISEILKQKSEKNRQSFQDGDSATLNFNSFQSASLIEIPFSSSPILQCQGATAAQIQRMVKLQNRKLIPTLQKKVNFDITLNSIQSRRNQRKKKCQAIEN